MTDLDVIEKVVNIVGDGVSKIYTRKRVANNKIQYQIDIRGHGAMKWMRLIRPYMSIRRGAKIDELFGIISDQRPFAHLGPDFCEQRGHSIKYPDEYYIVEGKWKACKECKLITNKKSRERPRNSAVSLAKINNISVEEAQRLIDELMEKRSNGLSMVNSFKKSVG